MLLSFSKFSAPTIAFLAFWLAKKRRLYNNYSIRPSSIWSDKITNERVARVGYNHFISNKGKWNNCFSKFSNRFLPLIFISTILQSVRKENLAHYFPYDVKLGLLALITHPLILVWFYWLLYATWCKSPDSYHAITPVRVDICRPIVSVERET